MNPGVHTVLSLNLFGASETLLFNDEAHLTVEVEWAPDGSVARLVVRRRAVKAP